MLLILSEQCLTWGQISCIEIARSHRALQLCYYALLSSDASYTPKKFAKVCKLCKIQIPKTVTTTPPKRQQIRQNFIIAKLFAIKFYMDWAMLDFCTQPGRRTTCNSGSPASGAPVTWARRATSCKHKMCPWGRLQPPRSFSPVRALVNLRLTYKHPNVP